MQNGGDQSGNAGNGVGMKQVRVELFGKLDKNVGKGAEMRDTRSGEEKNIYLLCRLIFTNEVLSHFCRKSYFPNFTFLTLKIIFIFRSKFLIKKF